jgi:AhpD family alkylhydroperoxidase
MNSGDTMTMEYEKKVAGSERSPFYIDELIRGRRTKRGLSIPFHVTSRLDSPSSGRKEIPTESLSQINGCACCLDQHTRILEKKGVKVEKLTLVQVWREAEVLFDEREQAALAWVETVTRVAETAIPEVDYQSARAVFRVPFLGSVNPSPLGDGMQ